MLPGPRLGQMVAAMVITYTAAVAAVGLRVVSRRLARVTLGFDDYTAIAALVSPALLEQKHPSNKQIDMCNRIPCPQAERYFSQLSV